MPDTRPDWLVPSEALIAPRALVIWEYARESATIIETAATLRRLLASGPTGAVADEALKQLIKNVRESGYRYADFIVPEYSSLGDDWAELVFALVAKLDRLMPRTDWRFVLSRDFPGVAWWRRDQRTIAPRPKDARTQERKTPRARAPAGLSLRDLVAYHFPQPEHERIVHAIDFQYDDWEIVASKDFLPREERSAYEEVGEVPVILVAIQVEHWVPKRFIDAVRALAESANRLAQDRSGSDLYRVGGFSVIALTEKIVDGTDRSSLSMHSRSVFRNWMQRRRHAQSNWFRGLVVPRIDLRTTPKFWRQFLADTFRQAVRAGWIRDQIHNLQTPGVTDVWNWSPAASIRAIKRLSALRASRHLTFVKMRDQLNDARDEASEILAKFGVRQSRRSGNRAWPSFQKKSHLLAAAKAASEELHRIFPTLSEDPRTASLPVISEVRVFTGARAKYSGHRG